MNSGRLVTCRSTGAPLATILLVRVGFSCMRAIGLQSCSAQERKRNSTEASQVRRDPIHSRTYERNGPTAV